MAPPRPLAHARGSPGRNSSGSPRYLGRPGCSSPVGFIPGGKDDSYASEEFEEVPTSRLAFVDSRWFQGFVGVVIFMNAVMIGAELEVDFEGWTLVEYLLLIFFTVELSLRCCYHGWAFFASGGNVFDVMIVLSGIMDSWVIPAFSWLFLGRHQERHYFLFEAVQGCFRMGRIFRLVRLVKIISPLYRLALGIAEAVQGMFWVLVFLVMMLYAAAILCTRLLGHGEAPGLLDQEEVSGAKEVREMFHSVLSSMFVLFEMMSSWSLMGFAPLFREMPITKLLAVLFYILMAWALLAVMTGVVSEKMIAVKEAMHIEERDREQVRRHIAGEKLRDLFERVDQDGSGEINREEFNNMLLLPSLSKILMEYSQVTTEELTEVFIWLDHDRNGVVDISEFVWGFNWLNEHMSPKSFLKFQEDASGTIRRLEKSLVASVNNRFDQLVAHLESPLRKLKVVADQVKYLQAALTKAEEELELIPEEVFYVDDEQDLVEVADVEDRLAMRIEDLLGAVESFEERFGGPLTVPLPRRRASTTDAPGQPGKRQ